MARYELVEGTSSKFWEISLDGTSFTVVFGRIGTAGQSQVKTFPTEAAALAEHDKLVREKTKKGYGLVGEAAAVAAPVTPKAPREPKPAAPQAVVAGAEEGFMELGNGYALTVRDGKIVARNKAGKVLASVPKELKDHEIYLQLDEALELLDQHEIDCKATVEGWMLRSLPVPRAVIEAVWPDATWRTLLENAVVVSEGGDGLLRGVSERGLGLVTLDGDTVWVRPETLRLPHPILLEDLDEYRSLLAEVGLRQGLQQLFRETFRKPAPEKEDTAWVQDWSGGAFDMLAQALGAARRGGYRVRGGAACCATWEGGTTTEARYDLGEGDPMYETSTGSLYWVDAEGATLKREQVGPIAWSEGMRMAAEIYKKRKVEEKKDGEEA